MLAPCRTHLPVKSRHLLRLLLAAALLLSHPHLHAQSVAPCVAADLDTTFRFGIYAPSNHVIVIFSRNISGHACSLTTQAGPSFYTFNQPAPLTVPVCRNCDHPSAEPPSLTLRPDEIAHQTIRWSAEPLPGALQCQKPAVMNVPSNDDALHPAQLISTSLLPPICSQVAFESYATGPAFGEDDSQPAHPGDSALRLSSYRLNYFPGEFFSLRAEAGTPVSQRPALGNARCPVTLLRQRTTDGSTRLEEFLPPQVRCSRESSSNPDASYSTTTFDSVAPIRTITGDTALQLYQLTGDVHDSLLNFAESNAVTLHLGDPFSATRGGNFSSTTSSSDSKDLTAYTGWQSNFSLIETSFGKQSVLVDQATHLEWLPLSATRNKSQDDIRHAMAPRKTFDGWRFATDDEVATFFRHFTNSATGRSNDPSIERAFQRMMGGPLASSKNNDNSKRSFTNGRIAGYYAPTFGFAPAGAARFQYHYAYIGEELRDDNVTATIDPHRTGSIDGDRTSTDTGTFLVREQ